MIIKYLKNFKLFYDSIYKLKQCLLVLIISLCSILYSLLAQSQTELSPNEIELKRILTKAGKDGFFFGLELELSQKTVIKNIIHFFDFESPEAILIMINALKTFHTHPYHIQKQLKLDIAPHDVAYALKPFAGLINQEHEIIQADINPFISSNQRLNLTDPLRYALLLYTINDIKYNKAIEKFPISFNFFKPTQDKEALEFKIRDEYIKYPWKVYLGSINLAKLSGYKVITDGVSNVGELVHTLDNHHIHVSYDNLTDDLMNRLELFNKLLLLERLGIGNLSDLNLNNSPNQSFIFTCNLYLKGLIRIINKNHFEIRGSTISLDKEMLRMIKIISSSEDDVIKMLTGEINKHLQNPIIKLWLKATRNNEIIYAFANPSFNLFNKDKILQRLLSENNDAPYITSSDAIDVIINALHEKPEKEILDIFDKFFHSKIGKQTWCLNQIALKQPPSIKKTLRLWVSQLSTDNFINFLSLFWYVQYQNINEAFNVFDRLGELTNRSSNELILISFEHILKDSLLNHAQMSNEEITTAIKNLIMFDDSEKTQNTKIPIPHSVLLMDSFNTDLYSEVTLKQLYNHYLSKNYLFLQSALLSMDYSKLHNDCKSTSILQTLLSAVFMNDETGINKIFDQNFLNIISEKNIKILVTEILNDTYPHTKNQNQFILFHKMKLLLKLLLDNNKNIMILLEELLKIQNNPLITTIYNSFQNEINEQTKINENRCMRIF